MNPNKLLPDDQRLTAYALGELEGDERAAVEAALRDDPTARATVENIRAMGAQLTAALASEPLPAVPAEAPLARAALVPDDDDRKRDDRPHPAWNLIRFPRLYYVVGGLAAAGVAVMVALREPPPAPEKKVVYAVTLAPAVEPPPAPVAAVASAAKETQVAPSAASLAAAPAAGTEPGVESNLIKADRLSLLDQAKSVEELAKKVGPLALGSPANVAMPSSNRAPAPTATAQTGAVEAREAAMQSDGKGGRVWVYPPDDKFVVTAQPSNAPVTDKSVVRAEAKPPIVIIDATPGIGAASGAGTLLAPSTGSLTLSGPTGTAVMGGNNFTATPPATGALPPSSAKLNAGSDEIVRLDAAGPSPEVAGFGATISSNLARDRELLLHPLSIAQSSASLTSSAGGRDNVFLSAAQNPVATFTIDADTASYSSIRRFLQLKRLPPRDAVRIEELVNYFPYRYAPPRGDAPFAALMEVAEAPWAPEHRLVRIGLKAREVTSAPRPPANLVFVIDAVDTERVASRMTMIKESLAALLRKLRPDDRVALVSCAGTASLVLDPTPVARSREIVEVIESLAASGSSSRGRGIQLAYDVVQKSLVPGGTNRVILCTDGNAGVTITAEGPLAHFLQSKVKSGVSLTAFGFGMGLYRDSLIEFLADYGSGNYGYPDTRREAEKCLAEEVNGPPVTIAKDVAVSVEFNPAKVASYRLIGYENRELKKEDFTREAFDADEIDAGHALTALFEIVPTDGRVAAGQPPAGGLKYQPPAVVAASHAPDPDELLTVKVNYKKPGGVIRRKLDFPLADTRTRFVDASADFKFAAAVAGFGMLLRDSPHKGATTLTTVKEWAGAGAGDDPGGYRSEFMELTREAQELVR